MVIVQLKSADLRVLWLIIIPTSSKKIFFFYFITTLAGGNIDLHNLKVFLDKWCLEDMDQRI